MIIKQIIRKIIKKMIIIIMEITVTPLNHQQVVIVITHTVRILFLLILLDLNNII
jgi:hypothetical protein